MEKYKLIAKTFAGLEPVLADEIKSIGGSNINPGNRAVFYEGDLKMIYKSNYQLRTALRILKEIGSFQFKDIDNFYLQCKRINWPKYLKINQSFAVRSTVVQSREFRNSMFASLKVKDAIADSFRENTGKRPSVDTENPEIIIQAHISRNHCSLSIDSSGESLHKRGYRTKQGEAPLSEVLAAGMILLSGWRGETDFVDPMCGSGTLPIEAAMIAQNMPPGRFRKEYAFMHWDNFDSDLFEMIKKQQKPKAFNKKIYASDISRNNMLIAEMNARRARVYANIVFQTSDIKDLKLELNNATVIVNPPYGERLKHHNINDLYNSLGERLKHEFAGNTAWILTSSKEYLKHVGLKASRKTPLFNGALQCTYVKYALFSGKLSEIKR